MHCGGEIVRRSASGGLVRRLFVMALLLTSAPHRATAQSRPSAPPRPAAPRASARRAAARGTATGTVRTDTLWAQALGARKALVVYLPPSYGKQKTRRYPVAYYLHGAGGNERNWVEKAALALVMDSLVAAGMPEMIIAMPDADDSYYTTYNTLIDLATCKKMLPEGMNPDHDCVAWPHYDDYIAFDIVRHMDAAYRTRADRAHRALGGLSMGGYGAVALALQYPALFSAAASHSGVLWPLERAPDAFVKVLPHPDSVRVAINGIRRGPRGERARLIFGADSAAWFARDPVHMLDRLRAAGTPVPALFADCGTEDALIEESRAFRDALATRGVPLAYHEWPGDHSWPYWRDHVAQSLAWVAEHIAK